MTKNKLFYKSVIILFFLFIGFGCNQPFVNKFDVKDTKVELPQAEKVNLKNSLEWWYLTGVLRDIEGNRYGVEYVFFHFFTHDRKSRTMINVAVTDVNDSTFYYDYLIKKKKDHLGDLDLLESLNTNHPINFNIADYTWKGGEGNYAISAKMKRENVGFNLKTSASKPVVLHGDSGYVNYGDVTTAGYYSYPRLNTKGQLFINGKTIEVTGLLWYDRQWNCGEVTVKDISWDWTAISLSNKSDLMLYRVNAKRDDKIVIGGTYIDSLGNSTSLKDDDIQLKVTEYWKSPSTGKSYPMKWEISIPKLAVNLNMNPVMKNQELHIKNPFGKVIYWEGMCDVNGTVNNEEVIGESYLEMTNK